MITVDAGAQRDTKLKTNKEQKHTPRYQGVGLTFCLARNLGGQPNLGRPQLLSHRGRRLLASPPFGRPPFACHSTRSFGQYSNTLTQGLGPMPNFSIPPRTRPFGPGPSTLLVTCRTALRRPNLPISVSLTKCRSPLTEAGQSFQTPTSACSERPLDCGLQRSSST